VSLATCILDTSGAPIERRAGSPDTRLMRYERRGDRAWFVRDDWAPTTDPTWTAHEATRGTDVTDPSDLGEWAFWSAQALWWEAQRDHEKARAARLTAWAARMKFLGA